MKKLITIFVIMILSMTLGFAQNGTVDTKLSYTQTWLDYTGRASDTVGTATTSWTYTALKRSYEPLGVYVDIALDSTGGTSDTVYVKLQYKRFEDLSYEVIDSVQWLSSSADTVISFSPSAATYTFTQSGGDTLYFAARTDAITQIGGDSLYFRARVDSTYGDSLVVPADTATFNSTTYTVSIPADTAVFYPSTFAMTVTASNQVGLSGYFRVLVVTTATNTLEAKINRLNFMFLKLK